MHIVTKPNLLYPGSLSNMADTKMYQNNYFTFSKEFKVNFDVNMSDSVRNQVSKPGDFKLLKKRIYFLSLKLLKFGRARVLGNDI